MNRSPVAFSQRTLDEAERGRRLLDSVEQRWPLGEASIALVRKLYEVNSLLWELEDEIRSATGTAAALALKRRIDTANLERSRCIAQLDSTAIPSDKRMDSTVPTLTTSIGSAADRLTVTLLRIQALSRRGDARTELVAAQFDDLLDAVDADLADVRRGRRRWPIPGIYKTYGDSPVDATGTLEAPAPGDVTAE